MPKSGDKTRRDLLLAANRIVLEQGVEHLDHGNNSFCHLPTIRLLPTYRSVGQESRW